MGAFRKKIYLGVTFLLMLAFGMSALMYVFFDVVQVGCKVVAEERIDEGKQLETVAMSVHEFAAVRGSELWHNGQLCDIRSYVRVNDTVYATVYKDEDEANVIKGIVACFDTGSPASNDGQTHVSRYHVHMPDGGKVLNEPSSFRLSEIHSSRSFVFRNMTAGPSRVSFDVIKPPPCIIC